VDEIVRRRMRVRIRLLKVDQVRAIRLQQAIDVEEIDPRSRLFQCQAFLNHRRTQEVGETNTSRARAEEEILLILQLSFLDFRCIDHAGKYDSGGALNVVVIDAVLVAVALKQVHSVHSGPILEVNATFREHFLDGVDELIDKRIQFVGRRACSAQAEVQGITKILLVVGAGVDIHGHQKLRRHSSAGSVELQLADGNRSTACADVSESKDTAAVRNADEAVIVLGPVHQDLFDVTSAR